MSSSGFDLSMLINTQGASSTKLFQYRAGEEKGVGVGVGGLRVRASAQFYNFYLV